MDHHCGQEQRCDEPDRPDWRPLLGAAGEVAEIAEIVHAMSGTNRAFRLIVMWVWERSTPLSCPLLSAVLGGRH